MDGRLRDVALCDSVADYDGFTPIMLNVVKTRTTDCQVAKQLQDRVETKG